MVNISNSSNFIPHIVLLISRLPEMIQKCFCTPDRAMDLTFQMNQPSSMFLAGEKVSSEWFSKVQVFFSTPFMKTAKTERCIDRELYFMTIAPMKNFCMSNYFIETWFPVSPIIRFCVPDPHTFIISTMANLLPSFYKVHLAITIGYYQWQNQEITE